MTENSPHPGDRLAENSPAAFEFRAEDYADDLDGMDLSPSQREELLGTLFSIIKMFVEMGFNPDVCGYLGKFANEPARLESAALEFAKAGHKGATEERDE